MVAVSSGLHQTAGPHFRRQTIRRDVNDVLKLRMIQEEAVQGASALLTERGSASD